jgi:hypothetical protein
MLRKGRGGEKEIGQSYRRWKKDKTEMPGEKELRG